MADQSGLTGIVEPDDAGTMPSIDSIMLGATHMPPGAICVITILMLANVLVRKLSRPLGLSPGIPIS